MTGSTHNLTSVLSLYVSFYLGQMLLVFHLQKEYKYVLNKCILSDLI